MKKVILLFAVAVLLSGCAGWNNYWAYWREHPLGYPQQANTSQAYQSNLATNPKYYNPNMDCTTYPPGHPIQVVGGQISYPQQDGSVIVCKPKGGDVYNNQGYKVGTYKPR